MKGVASTQYCSDTKFFGRVYTPPSVVEHILKEMFNTPLERVRICDPACGSGDFLVPIVREVCRRVATATSADGYTDTLKKITGYDIDSEAVKYCKERLSAVVKQELGAEYPHSFWRILNKDALNICPDDVSAFDWVVGNPPYVRIQHLGAKRRSQIRKASWRFFRGSSDLYMVFYELGLKLLKEGGHLLYISPSGWMRNDAGKVMRHEVDVNHGIVSLYDYKDHQVFPNVSTYACIAHLRKNKKGGDSRVYQFDGHRFDDSYKLVKSNSQWAIAAEDRLPLHHGEYVTLDKIADIRVGIQTLADCVFILEELSREGSIVSCKVQDQQVCLEKGALKRILKASVMKEGEDKIKRVIIYPYDDHGRLISENEFFERYPCAYTWLLNNKARLLSRDKGTFSEKKWYGFGREVGIRSSLGYKILTSGMNPEPNFQVCKDPDTLFYSGYGIKPRIDIDLDTLCSLLNSDAMDHYIRTFSQPFRGGWFSYAKRYVRHFPIDLPS